MIEEAIKIGKKLAAYGLIDGASGNLSFRKGGKIVITKTGVILDELTEEDFVEVEIGKKRDDASSDLYVHEKIYEETDYKVVLHCHGVYGVTLSLFFDEIIPLDLEGKMFIGTLKIIEGKFASPSLAEKIAKSVKEKGVCLVRGHGIYSAGENFDEAFKLASYLEHSCQILFNYEVFRRVLANPYHACRQ